MGTPIVGLKIHVDVDVDVGSLSFIELKAVKLLKKKQDKQNKLYIRSPISVFRQYNTIQ